MYDVTKDTKSAIEGLNSVSEEFFTAIAQQSKVGELVEAAATFEM